MASVVLNVKWKKIPETQRVLLKMFFFSVSPHCD
uniref:Uncharacterized protein n=1 Tax=Anguilla anguilla TaxID=7936 RepID=A0A0E9S7Z0_ANGAN